MTGGGEEPSGGVPLAGRASLGSSASGEPAAVIVTTTLPGEAAAEQLARTVVEEHLAACAQCQGPVRSIYRWQGRIEQSSEWYVHCKTSASRADALIRRIRALHPYDVPEILALPAVAGHLPYLSWVEEATREGGP